MQAFTYINMLYFFISLLDLHGRWFIYIFFYYAFYFFI